jgi:arabinofuranan 3-O-arabinosyltransferase
MVADTKFDLVTDPRGFLAGAMRLWDPIAAFGQIQNQAYGYLWPMGPFFVLGELAQVPEWAVQRAWWSLLLCLAFFGIVRLAQQLDVGSPVTQVVGGFAYVLTPRITTLLGGASIEVWPMALAPWVLIPLVHGSREGSVRRAAVVSALVVATCGGVNAIAVAAVLPLGVIWLLTRAGGPRKWRLLGWWTLFTALATLWWSLPLLVMGRYSAPFLDYIENATVTTIPTGMSRTFLGTSDWVAYFAGIDYTAGQELVTTPTALLMAALISAGGLVGIALRGNPHQRFLTLGVITGLALVGFGYAGDLGGFHAATRTEWLDEALAPLRNLHKFDVVLRVPLVLGLVYLLAELPALLQGRLGRLGLGALRAATVLALVTLALPWLHDNIAPRNGVDEVPGYWPEVAQYLETTDDGSVALVVPAAAFSVYTWGNTKDDILQGLAESPWAVRNVIPLAQPGNVVFLDAVTRFLESGHPSREFARFLADNGVGRLVVRNDLERFRTSAPDPSYVASLLQQAPGIELEDSFGPTLGSPVLTRPDEDSDVRVIAGAGISVETGSVDVYDVTGTATANLTTGPKALVGDPGSSLDPAVSALTGGQPLLAADADELAGDRATGQVLTDGMRRRETDFASVRWNESNTLSATAGYELSGTEHEHAVVDDPDRWHTTELWEGAVESVTASTSQSDASSVPPLLIGAHPGAALDGDPATAWRSARHLAPDGEFWQADLRRLTDLSRVTITVARDSAPVEQLDLWAGGEHVLVPAPEPGKTRAYTTGLGSGRFLRVTAAGRDLVLPGSFALAEVAVQGLAQQRYLVLPAPDDRFPVDLVSLARDPDRAPCTVIGDSVPCNGGLVAPGEDGDSLVRQFQVGSVAPYELTGTVSLRRTVDGLPISATSAVATTDAPTPFDVAAGPTALIDGNRGTTWIANSRDEQVTITFPQPREVSRIQVLVSPEAAASRPTAVRIVAGGKARTVQLDETGRGTLPKVTTLRVQLSVVDIDPTFEVSGQSFVEAPPGISSLTFGHRRDTRLEKRSGNLVRAFPCGSGPIVAINNRAFVTSVTASTAQLMRGEPVTLRICGSNKLILGADDVNRLVALPSAMFRIDSLQLRRASVSPATTQPLSTVRDGHGMPTSVRVPERSQLSVLTLPQNVNAGWVASLDGKELKTTRVAGWKQAWVLPAGEAGQVRLSYPPQSDLNRGFLLGLIGILLCVAVVVVPMLRRRQAPRELPALEAAPARPVDLVLAIAAGGLLVGWWGVVATIAAITLARLLRRAPGLWPLLAGIGLLVGALGLGWRPLVDQEWVVSWTQAWSLVAFASVVAALAVGVRRRPRSTGGRRFARLRIPGRSSSRPASG